MVLCCGNKKNLSSLRTNSSDDDSSLLYKREEASSSPPSALHSGYGTPISSIHGKLMKSQRRKDPMKYYKVISVLGEGSMGSVSKVKKRETAKGGSARPNFVKKKHQGCCFQILSWLRIPGYDDPKFIDLNQCRTSVDGSSVQSSYRPSEPWFSAPPSRAVSRDVTPQASIRKLGSMDDLRAALNANASQQIPEGTMYTNNLRSPHSTGGKSFPRPPHHRKTHRRHQSCPKAPSTLISYAPKKETCYALKSILLDRCSSKEFCEELRNEVEILKSLDHPNIVRCIETFDYHNRLFLVLELCGGGDLYTRDPYTEEQASHIIFCLAKAIAYLHSKGIVHRDIKFENIMFVDESPNAEVKIIDFGLSQKFAADEHLHDAVGTVYTMAPELLEGDYGPKVDVWSLGVITFMLLSSSMPFFGKDREHVIKKILNGRFHFSSRRWRYVSEEAKQFVKTLLRRNPVKRPTSEMVCEEPWLHHVFTTRESIVDADQMDNIQATIQSFSQYQTLKKLALMVVAYKSTSEEIGFLRKMFNKFDRQNDGEISLEEFKEALHENYDYSEEEAEAMFRGLDVDGTDSVHYIEFLAATIEAHGTIDEERLAEAFDRIDSDDSGTITVEDLKDFLGEDIPESYLEKVIDEAGVSTDHKITYEEFLALWDFDTDEVLREAKQNVGSRRVSRQASYVSTSSVSSGTDSAERTLSLSSASEAESGSLFYRRQRALSIHRINDDMHGHPPQQLSQRASKEEGEEEEQERVEVSNQPAEETREQMELLEKMEEILYNKGLLPEQQQNVQSV